MAPDLRSGLRIERDDATVPGRHEKQVLDTAWSADAFQEYRRAVGCRRQSYLILLRQRADVAWV